MERTFLKVARVALLVVTALSLLTVAMTAVYGAIEFLPSRKPTTPAIAVKLQDVFPPNTNKPGGAGTQAPAGGPATENMIDPRCKAILPKINQVLQKVGQKTTSQALNPATLQFESQTTVAYDSTIKEAVCGIFQDTINSQNVKLAPYFPGIDVTDNYFTSMSEYLDEALADSSRIRALQPNDKDRYDLTGLLIGFNNQFDQLTDQIKDRAEQHEAEIAAQKSRGTLALYTAGSAFAFFFSCCLILVFMRLELNTRELVEVIRGFESNRSSQMPLV